MSEVNDRDYMGALIELASKTATFRRTSDPENVGRILAEGGESLPSELVRLLENVECMRIDGWHLLDSESLSIAREQMGANCSLLDSPMHIDADQVERGIRLMYWNDHWIPMFSIEHGLLCIDLDPAPEGSPGQVIRVSVDGDERHLAATSLLEFCKAVVQAYETGDLCLVDDGHGLELVAREGYEFFVW